MYVLYTISKVLRNPRGGNISKLRKSVTAFFPAVTHVEKVFCISACLMSTKMVQYYPQCTGNFGLHETWCCWQYGACPGLIISDQIHLLHFSAFYILNCCYNMFLNSCIYSVCLCPYIRIIIFSDTSKSLILCNMSSWYCWKRGKKRWKHPPSDKQSYRRPDQEHL